MGGVGPHKNGGRMPTGIDIFMGGGALVRVCEGGYLNFHHIALTPVAYTHFRAHETREDLVCRLLLEKKNKN